MRMLGTLFVLALAVALVGYFRGWFAIYTTQTAGGGLRVSIYDQRLRDEGRATAVQMRRMLPTATATPPLAAVVTEEHTGTITAFEPNDRHLSVRTNYGTIDLIVPADVTILQDAQLAGTAALKADQRVLLTFEQQGDERQLLRIELLQ